MTEAVTVYLRLNPSAPTFYSVIAKDLLFGMSVTMVLAFLNVPMILAAFGHGGAWVKHVLARFGTTLLAAFGVSFLFYLGAAATSSVQLAPDTASVRTGFPIVGLAGLPGFGPPVQGHFRQAFRAGARSLLLAG